MVDSRSTDASFETKADAPGLEERLADARIVKGRKYDHFHLGVDARHLATRLQCVDVREMHIEHNHVGLESLRRLQQRAAVRDASHDLEIQCQQPAEGFHDVRVVVCKQHTGSRGQHGPQLGLSIRDRRDGGNQDVAVDGLAEKRGAPVLVRALLYDRFVTGSRHDDGRNGAAILDDSDKPSISRYPLRSPRVTHPQHAL